MAKENKTLVPVWIAYVDGKRLDTDHEGALKKITIQDTLNGIGTFSMLFDVSAEKLLSLGSLSLESTVSIHLGYKDDVEEVFLGEITEFAGKFEEFGHEMVEVRGCNAMYKFEHGKRHTSYENMTCSDAISKIIDSYSLSAEIDSFGASNTFASIHGVSDLDYILETAARYGKDVYAYGSKVYVKNNISLRNDDIVFEWGKSLISFLPVKSIRKLYSECNCVGWDSLKCEAFTSNVKVGDLSVKVGGSKNWTSCSKGGDGKWKNSIIDNTTIDEADAKEVATGALLRNSFDFIRARGKVEGIYKLLPGMRVNIKYVGDDFSGEYIAESVTHEFDILTGYTTSFSLKRNMC